MGCHQRRPVSIRHSIERSIARRGPARSVHGYTAGSWGCSFSHASKAAGARVGGCWPVHSRSIQRRRRWRLVSTSRTSSMSSGQATTSNAADFSHCSTRRADAPARIAPETNTLASRTTRTRSVAVNAIVERVGMPGPRRRRVPSLRPLSTRRSRQRSRRWTPESNE